MASEHLMLLDTASLYFRAFYGVPDSLRAPDGTPVNAVRGLSDFIVRLVEAYRPSHLVCCWDNDWRPAWRVELIDSYKKHRVARDGDGIAQMSTSAATAAEESPDGLALQVPLIQQMLAALGIAVVGVDGYEADDVIGTLADRFAARPAQSAKTGTAGMDVDVVTGDRDLFQLVDDDRGIRVLYIARGVGKHEQVDDAWIRNRFGVPAARYVDYAVLKGDPSDGLPGVSGVGDKTAAGLVQAHGGLEQILAAASSPTGTISAGLRSKLGAAIDYLAVAPQVVSVVRDVAVDLDLDRLRLPSEPAHPRTYARLTEELGLGTSATRMLAALSGSH